MSLPLVVIEVKVFVPGHVPDWKFPLLECFLNPLSSLLQCQPACHHLSPSVKFFVDFLLQFVQASDLDHRHFESHFSNRDIWDGSSCGPVVKSLYKAAFPVLGRHKPTARLPDVSQLHPVLPENEVHLLIRHLNPDVIMMTFFHQLRNLLLHRDQPFLPMLAIFICHSVGNEFFGHHRSHRKQKINSADGITASVELTHTLVVLSCVTLHPVV